ncbi:hypothetical protein KCU83_g166, partial [Aureobasidium melanogenum]
MLFMQCREFVITDRGKRPRCGKAEQVKDRGRAYGVAAIVDDDAGAAMEVQSSPAMDQGARRRGVAVEVDAEARVRTGLWPFLLQMAAHLVEFHVWFGGEQALQELVDSLAHGSRPAQRLRLHATDGAVLLELCDLKIDIGARHVRHGGADGHGRLALAHHALYRRIVLVQHSHARWRCARRRKMSLPTSFVCQIMGIWLRLAGTTCTLVSHLRRLCFSYAARAGIWPYSCHLAKFQFQQSRAPISPFPDTRTELSVGLPGALGQRFQGRRLPYSTRTAGRRLIA